MRAVQVGAALVARVTSSPSADDWRWAEICILLKRSAAVAGLAGGSGVLTGFPTIWAQNIKDVVFRQAGSPVAAIPKIAEQANEDLGFTISMQATENVDRLNRFLSQSSAIDVATSASYS